MFTFEHKPIYKSYQILIEIFYTGEPKELQVFREKIGAQLGATETISLLVVSNPKPNIIWDSDGDNLDTWNIQLVKRYQYNASSSVRIREETDFRHYTLRIWNTVGVKFQSITIVPRGIYKYCYFIIIVHASNLWCCSFKRNLSR